MPSDKLLAGNRITDADPLQVQVTQGSGATADTAVTSSVNDGTSSATLLAANPGRVGAVVVNDSIATLYVTYGATASTTSYRAKLFQDDEHVVDDGYLGVVSGIWDADTASGAARLTEW